MVTNMEVLADACYSIWREGGVGERLSFRRLEGSGLEAVGIAPA
jgi:hypothetical protein